MAADEAVEPPSPLSPLRKVERPTLLRSKSEALISAVFAGDELGSGTAEAGTEAFFATLFVLRVHRPLVERLAASATEAELIADGPVRRNVSGLFRYAAGRLADPGTDEATRERIVDTLSPMLGELLTKPGFSNSASDVRVSSRRPS